MESINRQVLEEKVIASLPSRFTLAHAVPNYLAGLYRLCLLAPGQFVKLRAALLDRMLDLTVQQAIDQSSFYADLYQELPPGRYVGFQELASLPSIKRTDVERAGANICSRYTTYKFSSYTSGTTTASPLIIDRSSQEQQYLINFFSTLQASSPVPANPQLVLSLADWSNGQRLQIPGRVYTFPVALIEEQGFYQAVGLLRRAFNINGQERRISAIAGSFRALMPLTAYLDAEGHRDLAEHIKVIQTSSQYQTAYSRAWVSKFWNCQVEDRYSLTEIFCGASQCPHCRLYHFDPFGVAEVVNLSTDERIESGRGKLLLSGLYPFTQMTPLIRYAPGDLVEVQPCDCPLGAVGFRLLGRLYSSLDLEPELGAGAFLAGGEVYEVLDPISDLNRQEFQASFPPSCNGAGGKPFFNLSREREGRASIEVELRYTPSLFPERLQELRTTIREGLLSQSPWMQPLFENDLLTVRFLSPGGLGNEPRIDN
jgi:phenylacetate-coenzyme A ligase PaaK-like adenylate-forming protein